MRATATGSGAIDEHACDEQWSQVDEPEDHEEDDADHCCSSNTIRMRRR
jgi:hypothetical protein